ncbi:hypothetical protein CSB93_3636 [Pseudomonas paraeruginosa]|uniref:Uncharacterized protein n=1 Tax=Pseudomonas paraeruginosa TaxID=2994495 RepID=A0A2R3J3I7_9PSED|nr:hypothetical protein CSB93_3636 [Pseudomonas paraeruginosa]AWE94567.1 hypothetical protein CSC28_2419 [Pseudomonas paraeruginosa]
MFSLTASGHEVAVWQKAFIAQDAPGTIVFTPLTEGLRA